MSSAPWLFTDGGVDEASCARACERIAGFRCASARVHACAPEVVDGGPAVRCDMTLFECPSFGAVCGRRTDGVAAEPDHDKLGALVALELEAVAAFERLARELHALGAPEELVGAARECAEDERRHVAMACALDGRAAPAPLNDAVLPLRSLLDVALENAVEGCVRETFGVVLAAWQAQHSDDARVRECYGAIARDEASHAALARRLDQWFVERSPQDHGRRVEEAKRRAASELISQQGGARWDRWLGLPDAATARALAVAATQVEWS